MYDYINKTSKNNFLRMQAIHLSCQIITYRFLNLVSLLPLTVCPASFLYPHYYLATDRSMASISFIYHLQPELCHRQPDNTRHRDTHRLPLPKRPLHPATSPPPMPLSLPKTSSWMAFGRCVESPPPWPLSSPTFAYIQGSRAPLGHLLSLPPPLSLHLPAWTQLPTISSKSCHLPPSTTRTGLPAPNSAAGDKLFCTPPPHLKNGFSWSL
jgi:hypothetical protein